MLKVHNLSTSCSELSVKISEISIGKYSVLDLYFLQKYQELTLVFTDEPLPSSTNLKDFIKNV